MTEKSPNLIAHQDALIKINAMNTNEEFDKVQELLDSYPDLKETNKQTLKEYAERQRALRMKINQNKIDEIKKEYDSVDEENFKQVPKAEVIEVDLGSPIVEQSPLWKELNPKKERKAKVSTAELVQEVQQSQPHRSVQSVTLHRVVKVPIKWIDYSNTEFGASVTADTKEEAMKQLQELMDEGLANTDVILKSTSDIYVKSAYDRGLAEGKNQAQPAPAFEETPKPAWKLMTPEDEKNLLRYERLKALINYVASNISNRTEMDALKAEFSKNNPPIQ